jgi:hypothetical protein
VIRTYVYFHHGSKAAIDRLYESHINRLREESRENEESFKENRIDFDRYERKREGIIRAKRKFERDAALSLHRANISKISFPITSKESIFDESVYSEFKRLLNPPYHYASEGKPPNYTEKQKRLVQSASNARVKICGLAGSGKTVVLAGRAVNAHKRHGGRVLILTFNITLGSYIHDRISAVREDFPWSAFDISNYHRFITIALNNADIPVEVPEHLRYDGNSRDIARKISLQREQYFEDTYYSNTRVFEGVEINAKYETILIDEIQDYKPEWIKIIRSYFP